MPTKKTKHKAKPTNERGFVLVTAVFVMLLLLSLGYFVSAFTLTEKKISSSQAASVQAYYLAESGVNEAIWRLKNDPSWKSSFESSATWTATITRNSALYPNASYTITINNKKNANADIVVTSKITIGLASAQRVIKTGVYKALGESVLQTNGEFADGNIDMTGTNLRILNGGAFSNADINIDYFSHIDADQSVKAAGRIFTQNWSSIIAPLIQSSNINPPAPSAVPLPAVSFNDPGDSNSLKARAAHVYTAKQFSDLLWSNKYKTLTLDGITYVTGDIAINRSNNLIINGALVSEGNIIVGGNDLLCILLSEGSNITINNPNPTQPSGLISRGRIDFELCAKHFSGTGIVYANDKINMLSFPNQLSIKGAFVSRKLTLTSFWNGLAITYDPSVVSASIGSPTYSPVITVDHWEEEY